MRLLVVNYEFPPLGGGAGNATAYVAKGLAASGEDVRVLTSAWGDLPAREARDGYEVLRVPALRSRVDRAGVLNMAAFMLSATPRALAMARSWRPDATLAFFGIPGGPVALALRWGLGVPYVVSLRGGDVPGARDKGVAVWHRLTAPLTRLVWRKAAFVAPNSRGLMEQAAETADYGTMRVVPNGVDCTLFAPSAEREWGCLRVVFVGRMVESKGLGELLEAFARAKGAAGIPMRLDLVGDGGDRARFEAQARKLGLGDAVDFHGWMDRSEVAVLLGRCHVFAMPTWSEGMSNAVLEAMASGLAVVTTDIPANAELVRDGEHGMLTPVRDVEALTRALAALADDPDLLARCAANSRALAQERFGWARVAEGFRDLCARASRGARGR